MRRLRHWLRNPEIIGAPDCPILRRWVIVTGSKPTISASSNEDNEVVGLIELPKWLTRDQKLMLHRFLPNVEDRDPHDHPRSFWTLVLWGSYFDLVPCECEGKGWTMQPYRRSDGTMGRVATDCEHDESGVVVGDVMKAGTIRRREAEHRHITQSGPKGAWTLVLMGPLERSWGFWRQGGWWPWKDYEKEFGFAMRCPTDEEREDRMLKYGDDGVKAVGDPLREELERRERPFVESVQRKMAEFAPIWKSAFDGAYREARNAQMIGDDADLAREAALDPVANARAAVEIYSRPKKTSLSVAEAREQIRRAADSPSSLHYDRHPIDEKGRP